MGKNYKLKGYTEELLILAAVRDRKATQKQLNEVVADVEAHLETPCGTLANYHGRFPNLIIEAMRDNYGYFLNEEQITYDKINNVMNSLVTKILTDDRARVHPQMLDRLINYLKGKETEDHEEGAQYIITGYPTSDGGVKSLPIPKNGEKSDY